MKLSTLLLTAFALNADAGKGNRRKQSRQANSGTFTILGLGRSYRQFELSVRASDTLDPNYIEYLDFGFRKKHLNFDHKFYVSVAVEVLKR